MKKEQDNQNQKQAQFHMDENYTEWPLARITLAGKPTDDEFHIYLDAARQNLARIGKRVYLMDFGDVDLTPRQRHEQRELFKEFESNGQARKIIFCAVVTRSLWQTLLVDVIKSFAPMPFEVKTYRTLSEAEEACRNALRVGVPV